MSSIDIGALAKWGAPRRVNTRGGLRVLRVCDPSDVDPRYQSQLKTLVKGCQELSWSRDAKTGRWTVCWWAVDVEGEKLAAASRAVNTDRAIPVPAGLELYPFQRAGVDFALRIFEQ